MAHLNGIPVRVEPVTARAPAAATAAAVGAGDAAPAAPTAAR